VWGRALRMHVLRARNPARGKAQGRIVSDSVCCRADADRLREVKPRSQPIVPGSSAFLTFRFVPNRRPITRRKSIEAARVGKRQVGPVSQKCVLTIV